jgi:hypothetical protein
MTISLLLKPLWQSNLFLLRLSRYYIPNVLPTGPLLYLSSVKQPEVKNRTGSPSCKEATVSLGLFVSVSLCLCGSVGLSGCLAVWLSVWAVHSAAHSVS